MRPASTALAVLLPAFVAPALLFASHDDARPATRVATIPAHRAFLDREWVSEPAVVGERRVPVYETVKVPVTETRRVPVFEDVREPVFATREVHAVEERCVPLKGPVEVAVLERRKRPVCLAFKNPLTCCDVSWHLWDRCETVCAGTRTEEGVVGWRTDRVPVTRTETFVAGTRTTRVEVGERIETASVGEREVTRCVGWRCEPTVIRPEVTRLARGFEDVPAETVTVVRAPEAAGVAPEPGTSRVLTEDEYRRATANGADGSKDAAPAARSDATPAPPATAPPAASAPPASPAR